MIYRNMKVARRAIVKEIGQDTVKALHKANRLADVVMLLAVPLAFFSNAYALATLEFSGLWVALLVAQGFILPMFQYVTHDVWLHRKIGGKYNNIFGFIYLLPMTYSFTWFRLFHEQHHQWVGSEKDSEAYKQDLDTRWKKFLFLTFVGVKLAMSRRLKSPDGDQGASINPNEREIVLMKREKWLVRAYFVAIVVSCFLWRGPLLGYVLPLLVVVPLVSSFRVIMEHAEANSANLYHTGVYYRTGFILDRLYLSHLADSHFVHHFFQAIPLYRCKKVANMLHPMLLREGVIERHSVLQILKGWYLENQKHRQLWWSGAAQPAKVEQAEPAEVAPIFQDSPSQSSSAVSG